MDPLGVLLEVLALAGYPGGLFLGVMAWVTYRGAGLPAGPALDARGAAAIAAALVGAAMAPLPDSPAASLPPPGGATPNLVAAILLLAVAVSLVAPRPWSLPRQGLAAFGVGALVLLGLVAASFSLSNIAGTTGGTGVAARILAAVAVLVALPLVVKPHLPTGSGAARAMVVASTVEVVLGLLIPPAQPWPVGPLWVLGLAVAVAAYAVLLRLVRAATQQENAALVTLAAVCSAAASVAAIIAGRP